MHTSEKINNHTATRNQKVSLRSKPLDHCAIGLNPLRAMIVKTRYLGYEISHNTYELHTSKRCIEDYNKKHITMRVLRWSMAM